MENNQPNPEGQGNDPILAGIPMEREEATKPDDKGGDDSPKSPEKKEDDKKSPEKEEAPKEQPKPDESKDKKPAEEDKHKDVSDKPARPERYIPIKQYTEEKGKFKQDIETRDARIKELETALGGKSDEKKDKAIQDYAEKHGVSEESVRDLVEMFGLGKEKEETKKPEESTTPELPPETQAELEEARELKAEKLFEQEFEDLGVPQLKELFPDATPEQLKEAKDEIRKAALTEEYLDKSIDFIVFKEKGELASIFKPKNPGVENGRRTSERKANLTVEDFKDGNNFGLLAELPDEERNQLVKDFPSATWTAYKNWIKQQEMMD